MSNFDEAIKTVLRHEGGYVNNPADPGGETKYGISKRSYPNLDIKNLTSERAAAIYKADWWDRFRYETIDDQRVATKIFDMSVNMGSKQAHKLLQRAVNAAGGSIEVDGMIGPQTLAAVNAVPACCVMSALKAEQAAYYRLIIEKNSALKTFEKGWMIRAYEG